MSTKDILPNGLLITTRDKQGKATDIGTEPKTGADFPYSVVACGEPRDLWRMYAPFLLGLSDTI